MEWQDKLDALLAMQTKAAELQIKQLETQEKHDAAASPDWVPPHGPVSWNDQYGPLAWPGTTPEGTSTLVRPRTIAQAMVQRLRPTNEMEPTRWTLTGVTDPESCTNADDSCGTPPAFGFQKACRQTREFGEAYFKTRELNRNQVGRRTNISDIDLTLMNRSAMSNPLLPMPPGINLESINLNSSAFKVMFEAFVGFERSLTQVIMEGDNTKVPAQTECGFIKEPLGLVDQIKTGHTDILSGALCGGVDSIVKDWGNDLGDTVGGGDPRDFVKFLGDIMHSLIQNNQQFGAINPGWTLVMRPRLWREIVNYWPCNFDTTRCKDAITSSNNDLISINLDPSNREQMRLQMQQNQTIMIEGVTFPVLLDQGMTRTTVGANNYRADLLVLPMSMIDFEYFPMDNPEAREVDNLAPGKFEVWNGGVWSVTKQHDKFCIYWIFNGLMRTHLKTPQLAAKITNIEFESRTDVRDPYPGDSYYKDGGTRYTPDYFPTVVSQ